LLKCRDALYKKAPFSTTLTLRVHLAVVLMTIFKNSNLYLEDTWV
jgi:hypothetical protein